MSNIPKGGSFLLQTIEPESIFTPEDFSEEHRMIAATVSRFVEDRVLPSMEKLESRENGKMKELFAEAGELGLLGTEIPEQYDGMELDKISCTLIAEGLGKTGCFGIAHGAQVGIGSLPIVYFGNDAQKKAYLPDVVTGARIAAYALTEPGSGSDALAAKTKAVLSPDGKHYLLNGAKQFITNAGLADFFVALAKIDGDKFSAFIVNGDAAGVTTGLEEKKMGLKGSSTRTVYFEDVKVPAENLLFEVGRGHVVAFNILNMGRHKLSANAVGNAKYAMELAAGYANERVQFKRPIAEFGLIKEKLAEMAVRTYVAESMLYRTAGLIDGIMRSLDTSGPDGGRVAAGGIEEYALECSLNKVFATEVYGFVADEGVQIHGGYGYVSEYPIERLYRDARIYRIFEGTNEINRGLIPTTLIRRAAKKELDLSAAVAALKRRMASGTGPREGLGDLVQAAKDVFLYTLGIAQAKAGDGLLKQQEILARLADMVIWTFGMESCWLRAEKARARHDGEGSKRKTDMARVFIHDTIEKIGRSARDVLRAVASGDELAFCEMELSKLMQFNPVDLISIRRDIAANISAAGKYIV